MTRTGRPSLAEGKARGIVFTVRLLLEERRQIDAAAKAKQLKVTDWARKCLIKQAKRDIL